MTECEKAGAIRMRGLSLFTRGFAESEALNLFWSLQWAIQLLIFRCFGAGIFRFIDAHTSAGEQQLFWSLAVWLASIGFMLLGGLNSWRHSDDFVARYVGIPGNFGLAFAFLSDLAPGCTKFGFFF